MRDQVQWGLYRHDLERHELQWLRHRVWDRQALLRGLDLHLELPDGYRGLRRGLRGYDDQRRQLRRLRHPLCRKPSVHG